MNMKALIKESIIEEINKKRKKQIEIILGKYLNKNIVIKSHFHYLNTEIKIQIRNILVNSFKMEQPLWKPIGIIIQFKFVEGIYLHSIHTQTYSMNPYRSETDKTAILKAVKEFFHEKIENYISLEEKNIIISLDLI